MNKRRPERAVCIGLSRAFTALAVLSALLGCSPYKPENNPQRALPPEVSAAGELLVGMTASAYAGVAEFRGIPFARPPLNELRWRAPQAHSPRFGKQTAQNFAPACYQDDGGWQWYVDVATAFDQSPDVVERPNGVSEDCLYLNVWAPKAALGKPETALPVLVWIHGGGNTTGWAYEPNYRGASLASRGIVVVSIAYRLNIFGFFSHPGLAVNNQDYQANYGLLDQIAALRWVRDHIAQFGGDPNRVTVAGESAGSANIGYLLAAPDARDLFQRSIHQSGSFEMNDHYTLADLQEAGAQLPIPGSNPAEQLENLRAMTAAELLALARTHSDHRINYPVSDGTLLPTTVPSLYAQSLNSPRDIMVGSNEDEWFMYFDEPIDSTDITAWLQEHAAQADPATIQKLINRYEPTRSQLDHLETALRMRCTGYRLAAGNARVGGRSWVYHFDRRRDGIGGERLRAYHGAEIPYMFDTHDSWLPTTETDKQLTDVMLGYWLNFIRSGNPNGQELPTWLRYEPRQHQVQRLGNEIGSQLAPDLQLCRSLNFIQH